MDVVRRPQYHILHPARSVSKSGYVVHEGAIGSLFGWSQWIPSPPRDIKELYKVDMQRNNDKDWVEKHKEHIQAWDRRMESLPIREPFFSTNTAADIDYMMWFKVARKSYLLSPEARTQHYAPPPHVGSFFVPVDVCFGAPMSSHSSPHVDVDTDLDGWPDAGLCITTDDRQIPM
ncbi:hypothetical protein GOBAR_AA33161 [Gossypium barbadense]|uniref:Aminotransferase-like plant mobile domain-containing protein n=1 Tax=Gossypium barbadense TaxID=3634 RepID=A0A2P5W904_GOSBA|nr:hypothetical protein GOBAR_AA33161 [Gossypium barbadense]